jgi:hypothetical protein
MPATRDKISTWLDVLYGPSGSNLTHMIVKCDSFDREECCYPVYVTNEQDVRDVEADNSDRTMEVYSKSLTKDEQLNTSARVFNYG